MDAGRSLLASQLNAMESQVMATLDSSMVRESSVGAAGYYTGGGGGGMYPPMLSDSMAAGVGYDGGGGGGTSSTPYVNPAAALGPAVDLSVLPIVEGRLWRKESSLTGRAWRERWVRVEDTTLAFYSRQGDPKPKDRLALSANSMVAKGDKPHRNKDVKYDFYVGLAGETLDSGVPLFAETEELGRAWLATISYMILRLREYEDAVQRQPQQQQQQQQYGDGGYRSQGAAILANAQAQQYAQYEAMAMEGGGGGGGGGHSLAAAAMLSSLLAPPPPPLTPEQMQALEDAAMNHTAYGEGLYGGERGEMAAFTVQLCEKDGSQRRVGGDAVRVVVEGGGGLRFETTPIDNGDGTYACEFLPTRAGVHTLHVLVDGFDIYGSPFYPEISGAPTSAGHVRVEGVGLDVAQTHPGAVNAIILTAVDAFDECRGVGGDTFHVSITRPGVWSAAGNDGAGNFLALDMGDGTYRVEYVVDVEDPLYIGAAAEAPVPGEGVALGPVLEVKVGLAGVGGGPLFPYPRPVGGGAFYPAIVFPGMDAGAMAEAAMAERPVLPPPAPPSTHASFRTSPQKGGVEAPFSAHPASASASAPSYASSNITAVGGTSSGSASSSSSSSSLEHHPGIAHSQMHRNGVDEETQRLRAEAAEAMASVAEEKIKLEEQKALVAQQMHIMTELGKKVKEDSERLAERARSLRGVSSNTASFSSAPRSSSKAASVTGGSSVKGGGRSGSSAHSVKDAPHSFSAAAASAAATAESGGGGGVPALPPPIPEPSSAALAAIDTTVQVEAPNELFHPEVIALADRHKRVLVPLWQHYASKSRCLLSEEAAGEGPYGCTSGLDMKRFVTLFADYDAAPTFLTKKELKAIFGAAVVAGEGGVNAVAAAVEDTETRLGYPAFIEALGRAALVALSKPAFATLYPTPQDKLAVLLEMWGLGDARKLEEVVRRGGGGGGGGGAHSVATSYRR